jgi:hypothetical protein
MERNSHGHPKLLGCASEFGMGDVGLDEIEATLASFKTHVDKPADDYTEAAGLVADMQRRARRLPRVGSL